MVGNSWASVCVRSMTRTSPLDTAFANERTSNAMSARHLALERFRITVLVVPPPVMQPWTTPSPPTCGRFTAMFHLLAETAAEEGRKTVLSMLVVGLVFLSVIVLGELTHWLRARNKQH